MSETLSLELRPLPQYGLCCNLVEEYVEEVHGSSSADAYMQQLMSAPLCTALRELSVVQAEGIAAAQQLHLSSCSVLAILHLC